MSNKNASKPGQWVWWSVSVGSTQIKTYNSKKQLPQLGNKTPSAV